MIRYVMVSSSSKGNAAFIYSERTLIQVDMGVTLNALKKAISLTPYRLEDIQALLITHEHSDHIKGLSLSCYKRLKIDTYAGEGTLKEPTHIVEEESSFDIGDFTVIPIRTSHDAKHPLGFVFIQGKEKLVYMTDTGYIPEESLPYMENANFYIVESNHDLEMLRESNRPLILKKRIHSKHGHLSNEESARYFADLVGEKTKEITLAHLSLECNTPQKALETWDKVFQERGLSVSKYNLRAAPASEPLLGGDK